MSAENKKRQGKPFSRMLKVLVVLVSLLLVLSIVSVVAGLALAGARDKPTGSIGADGIQFTVRQGESGVSVARRLTEDGIIRSEYLFRIMMKAKKLEQSLKAGNYLIRHDMATSDILTMIAEGKQILLRLTVPEGAGVQMVAKMAETAGVATADELLAAVNDPDLSMRLGLAAASSAGYLFPDTYLLPHDAGGEAVVTLMVETFKKRLAEHVPESKTMSPDVLHERVVLASIVEREYRIPEEAPVMASVFQNRLRIGMALQSCATVVYVITETQGKPHPTRLFDRDLKIESPFNTYLHPGLPPEPICNPGLTALAASLRPVKTGYLYFRLVDEEKGTHYFSASLDEHIRAASLAVKPTSK